MMTTLFSKLKKHINNKSLSPAEQETKKKHTFQSLDDALLVDLDKS